MDIDGDSVDEIFVGAPLSGGTGYDEGAVYVYGKVSVSYSSIEGVACSLIQTP